MRKVVQLLSVLGVLMFTGGLYAQDTPKLVDKSVVETLNKTPNFGFGVSAERPLQSAFKMYKQFKNSGVQIDNYEIVIWSKIVKDIKDNPELFEFINNHMDEGITVSVCSIAMQHLGVEKSDLPKGIKVVDNAYERIFELQALEYNVLIP